MTPKDNTVIIVHSITNLSANFKLFVQFLNCGGIWNKCPNQTNKGG